jgi:hypothetical protein
MKIKLKGRHFDTILVMEAELQVMLNTLMIVVPHPPHFFLFRRMKIKLKGRHFDTTVAMEAELQVMLNTLTEHDFQDAFKIMADKTLGTVYLTVANRSKVSF